MLPSFLLLNIILFAIQQCFFSSFNSFWYISSFLDHVSFLSFFASSFFSWFRSRFWLSGFDYMILIIWNTLHFRVFYLINLVLNDPPISWWCILFLKLDFIKKIQSTFRDFLMFSGGIEKDARNWCLFMTSSPRITLILCINYRWYLRDDDM